MSQTELEANRLAAALLMPKPLIMEELRSEPSLEQARRISEHCQASLTAATYRLVELSSYPIAVVWSTTGRRAWFQRSKEFGRAVELGSVSPQSFAHDCFRGAFVPTKPEPVPATAWLYEDGLLENARIWEESKPMPFYDAVLSLLYLREPVDHRHDSDEVLEELNPTEFTLGRTRARELVFADRTRLDVPLIDRNANIVIVECKQGAPNVQHVAQLRGYMRNVEKLRTGLKVGENIRGILVHGRARKLSPEVREDSRRNPQIELVQFSVAVGFTPSQ